MKMAMSVIQACRSLALSTWLLSFCFVHLLCLDFTVAEKEEWYTAFVNITYADPAAGSAELRSEKSECGRYGEQSPKQDARGQVALSASPTDRFACDPGTRFNAPAPGKSWVALIPRGNCTYKDKIRHAAAQNASAVVIYNVGSSNANETITMPHAGEPRRSPSSALGAGTDPVFQPALSSRILAVGAAAGWCPRPS
ncbi:RING finger protein 150 [Malurus melanocephalus]|uniref:RING finger protein 150 n=1 Tax=Malurus melanocephalus TaxID=175006 RepID=UPI002547A373|nr:RING finger protein 150 [Malurus melanocephalus]